MESLLERINCLYCGTKIHKDAPNCHTCGGPNNPEPPHWSQTILYRIKGSLKSKGPSVWSDRLAALFPLQFLISLWSLFNVVTKTDMQGSKNFLTLIMSGFVMLYILVFYPGWTEQTPEKRQEYGVINFFVILIYWIVLYKYLH